MAKITFKDRTGDDLFAYMKVSLVNSEAANRMSLNTFCMSGNQTPLTMEQITNIQNKSPLLYLQLCNSVFSIDNASIDEDEEKIKFTFGANAYLEVIKKKIDNSTLQQIQIQKDKIKKGKEVELLQNLIYVFFEISPSILLLSDYCVAMRLCNDVNLFLATATEVRDDFDIDDELLKTSGVSLPPALDSMDRASGRDTEETTETKQQELIPEKEPAKGFA